MSTVWRRPWLLILAVGLITVDRKPGLRVASAPHGLGRGPRVGSQPMAGNEELTRDAALLVLNDHCGEEVDVYVHVDRNVRSARLVMHAQGPLRHWRDDPDRPEPLAAAAADDMAGVYEVAGAHVDVTEFRVGWLLREGEAPAHGVAFELVHDEPGDVARDAAVPLVWLTVKWGGPEPEER